MVGSGTFELIILGHSCGIADSDVIKTFLSSENLKTAVVLCHTLDDFVLSFNNIKAMLNKEKFNELPTFSKNEIIHDLYLSVEKN